MARSPLVTSDLLSTHTLATYTQIIWHRQVPGVQEQNSMQDAIQHTTVILFGVKLLCK